MSIDTRHKLFLIYDFDEIISRKRQLRRDALYKYDVIVNLLIISAIVPPNRTFGKKVMNRNINKTV